MTPAKTTVYVCDDEGRELVVDVKFNYSYQSADYWSPEYFDLRLEEANVISFDGIACSPYPSHESLDDAIIEKCWEYINDEL